MKKYLLISLFAATSICNGKACGVEIVHNYYLFHTWMEPTHHFLYEDEDPQSYNAKSRINQFWRDYTGNADCKYINDHDEIKALAKKKRDTELLNYMAVLDTYLGISETLSRDEWDYPTKAELVKRKRDIINLRNTVMNYKGTRLKAQYMLMKMRTNMLDEKHAANKTFWEQTASKLPASVYRDLMENIYAGALFHLGLREKSCDIFARQGDAESIQWALRKYRNFAGIQRIYADNPSSYSLYYLIDEYVNEVQEFVDGDGFTDWDEEKGDFVHNRQKEDEFKKSVNSFIQFAQQVIAEGKTNDPCLWQTACGMIHYELGMQQEAEQDMERAKQLKGQENSKQVLRCVNILVMTGNPDAYSNKLVEELKWLSQNYINPSTTSDDSYLYRAQHRILLHGLAKYYHRKGQHGLETAVWGYFDAEETRRWQNEPDKPEVSEYEFNPYYSSEYYYQLDTLSAQALINYYNLLQATHQNPVDQYIISHVEQNKNYYYDIIGTKLLAEGQFERAIPYLEEVPLSFMEQQNISYYLAHRDYHVERWYKQQRSKDDKEGSNMGKLTSNPKLDFCREILQLKQAYNFAPTADERCQLAYKLGTMLFQASPLGECWYISNYGQSCGGEGEQDRSPLFKDAKKYLEESCKSTQFDLHLSGLYAVAYLPVDSWSSIDYQFTPNSMKAIYTPIRNSYQYAALDNLNKFVLGSQSNIRQEILKCDVLKQFRKSK